jgi:hypothetical protein
MQRSASGDDAPGNQSVAVVVNMGELKQDGSGLWPSRHAIAKRKLARVA